MNYKLYFTKQAQKDLKRIKQAGLQKNTMVLLDVLRENPYANPPPYEKLKGTAVSIYSRRINIQHRLVYQVYEDEKAVKIIRLWTHYE